MKKYFCMDRLSNVMNKESEDFVSIFCRPKIQEDEVSKFFCSKSAHAGSFQSRFYGIAKWASLHHVLMEVIHFSRNVQVNRPLLEMCGRHVIMLQMEVPQVAPFRQLAYDVS